jgi:pimeloyl-ACP methyl ester carboxylesterase
VRAASPDPAGDIGLTPSSSPAPLTAASTDGVTVTIHDLGGDGPPLLLCHATGFHGRVWQPVADRLPHRHSYAPDLRGHGDTPAPPGVPLVWQGFAEDVLAVVDALGLTHVLAAGHSKGGASLVLAELARPGTFSALYLYEPVIFPVVSASEIAAVGSNPLSEGARRRRATFDSFDAAYENFATKPPLSVLHPDALRAYVDHGFRRQAGTVTLKCRPEVEAEVYTMGPRHGAFERLAEVQCPVTVACGDTTDGPGAVAALVAEALPHGRLEEHPDLGHFGPMEDPAAIAAAIDAALQPA